ncbi:MAG: hypothetical protein QM682_17590 [Paracoccus sp. (in: a-proteobacteria)]|uniref:hypothetical protein n=1 Tax=Paracoccus sp. TaxID=267 RepID=UPI0039E4FC98
MLKRLLGVAPVYRKTAIDAACAEALRRDQINADALRQILDRGPKKLPRPEPQPRNTVRKHLRCGLLCGERQCSMNMSLPSPAICLLRALPIRLIVKPKIGQLDPSEWHGDLDSPHLADAIMDRLVQRAHRIVLKGEFMCQRR